MVKKLYEEFLTGLTIIIGLFISLSICGVGSWWLLQKIYWSDNLGLYGAGLILGLVSLIVGFVGLSLLVGLGKITLKQARKK